MWSVEIFEENGKFVVRTVNDADINDMKFDNEGFAKLYARGQRVHFSVLEEIGAARLAEPSDVKA